MCTVLVVFSIFTMFCSYYLVEEHIPQRNIPQLTDTSHRSLTPQPLIYFLSLWICLFWTFQVDRIIYYMDLCYCLLSLSMRFSRLIHAVTCISTPFCFMAE